MINTIEYPNSRVCICTLYTPNIKEYASVSTKNKIEYCKKYGYDFVWSENKLDNRAPSWSKIPLINHLFCTRVKEYYDWLVWIDADAIMMNFNFNIFDWLESQVSIEHKMVIALDCNGPNMGVFAVRFTPYIHSLCMRLYGMTDYVNHQWWEQGAFHSLWNDPKEVELKTAVKAVHQRPLNTYLVGPEPGNTIYREGDFILHTCGLSHPGKVQAINLYLNEAGR